MRRKTAQPLPAATAEEFWAFVLWARRSVFDPWWLSPACDRAFAQWKGVHDG